MRIDCRTQPDTQRVRQQPQVERRGSDVGEDRLGGRDLIAGGGADRDAAPLPDDDRFDARAELQLTAGLLQARQHGVGDATCAADGNLEPAAGREQSQHEAKRGAGEIFRPEIDVQRQAGNHAPSRFGAEEPSANSRRRVTGRPWPSETGSDAEPQRRADAGQRREQSIGEALAHVGLPVRQPAPGVAVGAKGSRRRGRYRGRC